MQLSNMNNRKETINTFLLVLGYGLVFYLIQVFIYKAGFSMVYPQSETLARWDAPIYWGVSVNGYFHTGINHSNCGVYVLLPWVWRILHAGYMGMTIANLVFFAIGFTIITSIYKISSSEKLLWLSTPSLYFIFAPYTEALFFLLMAISFYGIVTKNKWWIWIGLFLVSMSRATALFLIPSLFIMELLTNNRSGILKVLRNYFIYYALPTLAGTFAFIYVQYYQTGEWFAYYRIQQECLDHKFSWPDMPLNDFYGTEKVVWLCALAMLPCFIALIFLFKKIFKWVVRQKVYTDKLWIMTLGYLPIILFIMVFCNPKWGGQGTNLLGIHRYVFCSPFIFVFLYNMVSKANSYKPKHFFILFLMCNIVWLCLGSYTHIQWMLFYNFNTLIAFGYLLHANNKISWATSALTAVNLFFQITLYQLYLHGVFTD